MTVEGARPVEPIRVLVTYMCLEQIDPSQVPLFARPGGTNGNTEHPVPLLTRSDFWVQGMMFGLEFRY